MAVSGSTDAKSTAIELITDARSLLGIHAEEEPIQAHEVERARRILTKMLKAWEADGIGSWILTEGTLTLVAGTNSYVFGSGGAFVTVPFEITQARINRGGNDLPMHRMSREEYYNLPLRTNTGYPTSWFYDRQRDNGTFYVWPSPDTTAGTVTFTYRRRIMDIDANTDNFDLPPEWEEAITENLAVRMAPMCGKSGSPEAQDLGKRAAVSYFTVKGWDTGEGEGSIMMLPDRWDRY